MNHWVKEPKPHEQQLLHVLRALVVLGVILRVVLLAISEGSDDLTIWRENAQMMRTRGLWETYQRFYWFNHPPLMGLQALGLYELATVAGVPFRVLFKVPPLLADLSALWLLFSYWRPRGTLWATGAVALFSCNPISIWITAFHGSTDSLGAVLCLLAASSHEKGRPFSAGLALGAAVNVKLIAVLIAPCMFFLCRNRVHALRLAAGAALWSLPFLVALIVIPAEFYRNVLQYSPRQDIWGITAFAHISGPSFSEFARFIFEDYARSARYVIFGVVFLGALLARTRRLTVSQSCAASLATFLFLTPGFGVQYLVWLVPVLAAASLRHSLSWALLGGSTVSLIYYHFMQTGWPLRSTHATWLVGPVWLIGVFAWAWLGRYVLTQYAGARASGIP